MMFPTPALSLWSRRLNNYSRNVSFIQIVFVIFSRCHDEDNYAYTGDTCEIKTEKLELESHYIVAIAAGSGGILVLIILILIGVLLWKRNERADKG